MPRPSRWPDVVQAAAKVFSQKGYSAASLEDIAAEVGMFKGSLYNYITNKEDLLFAVVRSPADHLLTEVRRIAGSDLPPSEKVRRVALIHADIIEDNLPYVQVYLQEIVGKGISPEWAAMDREYLSLLTEIIDEGRRMQIFDSSIDSHLAARMLVGSLNWMTRWYVPGDRSVARAQASQMADIFLSGSLAHKSG